MLRKLINRAYHDATNWLPGRVSAKLDRLWPSIADSWGGPMNGQVGRCDIVRDLSRRIEFQRVVETGTFRGTTTQFLSHLFGTRLDTAEASPRFFHYSVKRLRSLTDVEVFRGDSRALIRELSTSVASRETTFFYLDAHWNDDLPLAEELCLIRDNWERAVVMVDDFRVDGDTGYSYDDYGPGKRLTLEIIPDMPGWAVFFPQLSSQRETGAKRGCCVIASPSLSGTVAATPLLRPAQASD